MSPATIIEHLNLQPHPEGGWFAETWRAGTQVDTARGPRSAGTSIAYLLNDGAHSTLHRIASDEVWYHHAGGELRVEGILADGQTFCHRLGGDLLADQSPQCVVPAGAWFGASCADPHGWALVGCAVAPGFDFADFELADRQQLLAAYPRHRALIERLT